MEVAVKKTCGLLVCAHLARKAAASGVAHWSCNREGPLGLISRSHHHSTVWGRSGRCCVRMGDGQLIFHSRCILNSGLLSPSSFSVSLEPKYPL